MDYWCCSTLILIAVSLFKHIDCLMCYSCAPTTMRDQDPANLNCLANSTEITCRSPEDRCYSLTTSTATGNVTVEKGCTRSGDCLGNRICCSRDFCNAGQGSRLKTGVGKPCSDVSSCVQGADDMACNVRRAGDVTRVCNCWGSKYQLGAICKSMSKIGGPCQQDEHCLTYYSFCEKRKCRCGAYFYANDTVCMLKVGLGAACVENKQCREEHSECVAAACTCRPGYDTNRDLGICSGSPALTVTLSTVHLFLWMCAVLERVLNT